MVDAAFTPCLSLEAFFALIAERDGRYELHDGEMFAMAGGSLAHAVIGANALAALRPLARRRGCLELGPDFFVLRQAARPSAMSPDAWVLCGERPGPEARGSEHPVVVVEVLSPSTMAFDRGQKMLAYQAIASLQHVVLIYQDRMAAEVWSRPQAAGKPWTYVAVDKPDGTLDLPALDGAFTLGELYRDLDGV